MTPPIMQPPSQHIPELQRRTNFTIRPIYMLIRFLLSLILIPACLSSALIAASLQCGAGFGEAVDLLDNSTQIVWSTARTHYGTVKIGVKVLLGLEDAPEGAELTAYILKASADADEASAAIKNALAKSMQQTWQAPSHSCSSSKEENSHFKLSDHSLYTWDACSDYYLYQS